MSAAAALNDLGHEEGCQCPTCLPEAHPAPGASTALAPRADTYEWNGVRFYAFRGCPCCIAAALGRCLGYADDGGHLVEVIRQKWTKETEDGKVDMLEGEDFAILAGDDLREFKELLEDNDRRSLSSAARLMVLFEGGADMVGMKTDKPLGFELRKALKTSILPKLRRRETITSQDAAQVPVAAPATPPQPALAPGVKAPHGAGAGGGLDLVRRRGRAHGQGHGPGQARGEGQPEEQGRPLGPHRRWCRRGDRPGGEGRAGEGRGAPAQAVHEGSRRWRAGRAYWCPSRGHQ